MQFSMFHQFCELGILFYEARPYSAINLPLWIHVCPMWSPDKSLYYSLVTFLMWALKCVLRVNKKETVVHTLSTHETCSRHMQDMSEHCLKSTGHVVHFMWFGVSDDKFWTRPKFGECLMQVLHHIILASMWSGASPCTSASLCKIMQGVMGLAGISEVQSIGWVCASDERVWYMSCENNVLLVCMTNN